MLLTPTFVNSSAGATYVASNGQWLDSPDAALIGDVNSSASNQAVLLSLGNPTYDEATKVWSACCMLLRGSSSHVPSINTWLGNGTLIQRLHACCFKMAAC